MMRIKEAIQRKKLIHEMNEEWKDYDFDNLSTNIRPIVGVGGVPSPIPDQKQSSKQVNEQPQSATNNNLQNFVVYLNGKLNDLQKRALKVTWKRLSEAPKTSGRGTIHIMEKVLNKLCELEPAVPRIFYKSAFLSCIEDRKNGRATGCSISTIRDHAHILVQFVDSILTCLFDGGTGIEGLDPESIGRSHAKLYPLGFERRMWHQLGECFAEVMFMQECIRAYPHAPSAWSLLAVAMTDKMFSSGRTISSQSSLEEYRKICPNDAKSFEKRLSIDSNDEIFITPRESFNDDFHGRSRTCPISMNTSGNVRHQGVTSGSCPISTCIGTNSSSSGRLRLTSSNSQVMSRSKSEARFVPSKGVRVSNV
ncbi:unnamed protein product [Auanema sp. JU1783]|nr:unnamed protein product [Auanema sp. JU1783]